MKNKIYLEIREKPFLIGDMAKIVVDRKDYYIKYKGYNNERNATDLAKKIITDIKPKYRKGLDLKIEAK